LNWGSINKVNSKLDELLDTHKEVFQEELGLFKGVKAKLHVRQDTKPKFCKPRSVPYALREPIEKELDRLVEQGVLEKVEYSEWAAPIVPVVKPDGSVRICGDYKVTVNQYLEVENTHYQKQKICRIKWGRKIFKVRP
jgi:hypothetical protein